MDKSVCFAQFACRRTATLRARGASRLWFPYGATLHKQLFMSAFCSTSAPHPPYLSPCRWSSTECGRLSRLLHTQAEKEGASTGQSARDGGEGKEENKFEVGERTSSECRVNIRDGGSTGNEPIAAAGKGGSTSSNVASLTVEENNMGGMPVSRVSQVKEDVRIKDARGNHGLGASGRDQAVFDQRETGLLRQQDEKIGERNDVCPENGGQEEQEFRVDVEMTPNPLARKFFVRDTPLLPPTTDNLNSKSFSKRDKYDHIPLIKSLFEVFQAIVHRSMWGTKVAVTPALEGIKKEILRTPDFARFTDSISDFTSILVAKEYLTVVKKKADAWEDVERKVRMCLLRHLKAGDLPLSGVSLSSDVGTRERSFNAQQQQPPQERSLRSARAVPSQSDDQSVSKPEGGTAAKHTAADDTPGDSGTKDNEDDEEVAEAIKALLYLRARPMLLADGGDLEMMRFDADTGVVWVYLKGSCQGCPSSLITVKRGMKQMLQYYIPEVEDVRQCDENGDPLEEEVDD